MSLDQISIRYDIRIKYFGYTIQKFESNVGITSRSKNVELTTYTHIKVLRNQNINKN